MKQGEQKSTRELEALAMNVETFNPQWHNGEFLGPSSMRQETNTEDDTENSIKNSTEEES